MFKTIGKLLVIVAVVALFTAGIYALVQNSSFGPAGTFAAREGGFDRTPPNTLTGVNAQPLQGRRSPEGFRGEREGGEGGFSFFRGMAGLLGHALQIALVTLLVLFIRRWLGARNESLSGQKV